MIVKGTEIGIETGTEIEIEIEEEEKEMIIGTEIMTVIEIKTDTEKEILTEIEVIEIDIETITTEIETSEEIEIGEIQETEEDLIQIEEKVLNPMMFALTAMEKVIGQMNVNNQKGKGKICLM